MQESKNCRLTIYARRSPNLTLILMVTSCLIIILQNYLVAIAQANETLNTKENATVFAGPGNAYDTISVLEPNVQVTIIPPSSVIIGKGVTIGEGTLIEGKPWINIRLPDGRSGYVKGSAVCSKIENTSVRIALCAN